MARFRTHLALLGSAAALTAGALAPAQLAGAQPAAAASCDWVALGDSYTAGVIPAAGDIFEIPRDGCERTDQSYPQVIDRDFGSLIELTNVSCGAATIEDVTFSAQQPAIEKSAGTRGTATFVNLYDATRNHSVRDAGKWVEGVLDHDDRPALVHPNARVRRNAADHVASVILNAIAPD